MKKSLLLAIAILFPATQANSAFDSAVSLGPGQELVVTRVTPEGEDVQAARQIVVQFNRAVVPTGEMARDSKDIPIEITPKINCEWRWLNTSALSCNLKDSDKLQQSSKYNIKVNPGIKAEDGKTISAPYQSSFITQRPDVNYPNFSTWKSPSFPEITLSFNQPVTKKSAEQHIYMQSPAGKMAIVAEKFTRDEVEYVHAKLDDKSEVTMVKHKVDVGEVKMVNGEEARQIWLIKPEDELPLDSSVNLKVEPGLVSSEGGEKGVGNRDIVVFDTFPEFKFLGIRCTTNNKESALITDSSNTKLCNPLSTVSLAFSAPLKKSQIQNFVKFTPDLANGRKDINLWEYADQEKLYLSFAHKKDRSYDIYLPTLLKAGQKYEIETAQPQRGFFKGIWHWIESLFSKTPETDIEDGFSRKLSEPIKLSFTTDHRLPNFEIIHHEAVLEKNADTEVPLYVNNLDNIKFTYHGLSASGVIAEKEISKTIPKVEDVQFAIPFGVKEMLGGKSGAIYGTLNTSPAVDKGDDTRPYRLFAQVTPYQVHVKLGHFTTLVWVTDLDSGKAVDAARVTVYDDSIADLKPGAKIAAESKTDKDGIAILPGTETLDPDLKLSKNQYDYDYKNRDKQKRLFIKVEKNGEMGLLPVSSDFLIDSYQPTASENVYPEAHKKYAHMQAWGTTAQGIYRAGDTIQYKIYVRNQDNNSLVPAPKSGYNLKITDPKGKVALKKKGIVLNEFGSFGGEFTVPKKGAVGWYNFKITADFAVNKKELTEGEEGKESSDGPQSSAEDEDGEGGDEDQYSYNEFEWHPIRVLVSDFTPVPFKVTNQLNGDIFKPGDKAEITTNAALHSGGAYTDAKTRVTAMLDASWFNPATPLAKDFQFDSFTGNAENQQIFQENKILNDKGELISSFTIPDQKILYGKLTVESAVQDDRGKNIAALATADYVGVDRLIGLKGTQWIYDQNKPAKIEYLVVDGKGNPASGTDVEITIEAEQNKAARVKGAGNAYITEYKTEWVKETECKGKSVSTAAVCEFTPKSAGSYRATANIKDTAGKPHKTMLGLWVAGKDYVLWNEENDYGLKIVPEKAEYKVGDKARYLVKNPFPGATALITVERYGVIDKFVQKLEGSTPVIEFEVKPDYLPGFYLSILVQSPRVDKPIDANQVDLGKPTFRIGYITVPVKDKYKEMKVTAKAENEVYKPRDHVKVALHAEPKFPRAGKKEPVEIAVTVLDESVFDLIAGGKDYFDPYKGFFALKGLDLRNYSLLTRLVGRQKFEKKGANPGGDGGADLSMRSIFKFVSYWNPSLKTDANGNASIEFDAPDNLTGWRVLAIATTPTDRLGLGEGKFKVNKPTEIRPVMPNQVTEGDEFKAGFSVMNRTDKPRELIVSLKVSGDAAATDSKPQKIKLDPYKRQTVWLAVKAKILPQSRELEQGSLNFTVTARDAIDSDGLQYSTPVNKRRSLETAANYGTTTQDKVEDSISIPEKIFADVGSVSVVLSPSVISNVQGAFKYLRDYPYICWEQRLTKAVMASHYLNLKQYMPDSFTWKNAPALPDETLTDAANYQAPNGGMTYFGGGNEYVDPYLSAYTGLAFNWMRSAGYKIPETVEYKLHGYLKNLLHKDELPTFYSEGMASTTRAVALAVLAVDGEVTLDDINRYKPHVSQMSLFGKTHFLAAALKVKGAENIATETAKNILGSAVESGGKFSFNETIDDGYRRMLSTPLRENCVILDTFTAMGERPENKNLVADIPFKLVRTITQTRKGRDHWENTQENIFCMNALIDYSRIYENVKPNMQVKASMDAKIFGETTFDDLRNPEKTFEKPLDAKDPGRKTKVIIEKQGEGRLYYSTRLSYAPTDDASKPINAGIEIKREYSIEKGGKWELLKPGDEIKRGNIIRADIFLSLPTARNFVVVDDPVPGGLEPVNRELANNSKVDDDKAKNDFAGGSIYFNHNDWIDFKFSRWSFYLQEIRHDSVRYYSDYLEPGNYHLSYTAQAIAPGKFSMMPIKAEEMYDPDIFGKGVSGSLIVNE